MLKKLLIIAFIIIALYFAVNKFTILPSPAQESLDFVRLPPGFKIEVFVENLGGSKISTPGPNPGPRMLDVKEDFVFVTIPSKGEVMVFEDKNKDSKPESAKVFINNLNNPHGIAFYQDWVYIAEEDKVIRVKNEGNAANLQTVQKLVDLPPGGHWTRTIKIFDDELFISIGSSCNVCNEEDQRRASIMKCDLEGKNCEAFASGLRNSVDFEKHKGKIYATENSRDGLGEDIPSDEINIIEKGKIYGWPICYGNQINDRDFDKNTYIVNPCVNTEAPFVEIQSHSAPLGLEIYKGKNFPEEYKDDIFVAYHGSWDRDPPTGYKIVAIDLETKQIRDFATGWLSDITVKGRPVDIVNFRDGLLVSDDNKGKIYRIYYEG